MIVTLTANPALDRTIALTAPLRVGEVQTVLSWREDAGGKGINVARAVAAAGQDCTAIVPLASHDPFGALLRASGLTVRPVAIGGRVRVNLAITDPDGVTTKLNVAGEHLTSAEESQLIASVVAASAHARWLVLAGSLPPGASPDLYARAIEAVRAAHGDLAPLIAVDASGAALAEVVERARPDLIKPNDTELEELTGAAVVGTDVVAAALAAVRTLVPARVGAALVTLGGHGAVLVADGGAWCATPPPIDVVSTVGAGDSSLAGYVLAHSRGAGPEDRLRLAMRYGAAAASLPGTQAPAPDDLPDGDVPITRLF